MQYVLYAVLAAIAVLIAVILIRTAMFKPKKQVEVLEGEECFDKEKAVETLRELVRCKTVSSYDKIKEDLVANKEEYSSEIKHMQELITKITDLSADIQAKEQQNKDIAKTRFSHIRSQIRETKHGQKAVASYYASMMNNTGYEGSQFWDKKK